MISPSTGATTAFSHSQPGLQLPANAGSRIAPDASVPKQNGPDVPKLHAGSFQSFEDAFDSMLSQAGSTRVPNKDTTQVFEAKPISVSSAQARQESTPTASQFATGGRTGDSATPIGSMPGVLSAPKFAGENHELSPCTEQELLNVNGPLASKKASDTKLGLKDQSSPATQAANEPAGTAWMEWNGNPGLAPALTATPDQADLSNITPDSQLGPVRTVNVAAVQKDAGVQVENLQANVNRAYGEVEAFRLDLHRAPGFVEAESASKSLPAQNADTRSASGDERPGDDSKDAGESRESAAAPAMVPDKAVALNTTPNPSDPAARTAGSSKQTLQAQQTSQAQNSQAQNVQADRRSPGANVGTSEKTNEKTPAGNASDTDGPKVPIAAPQPSFPSVTRTAGEIKDVKNAAVMTETVDRTATTVGSAAREMVVRVQGSSGEVVSVRLLDQGGQVQVAVRSNDPSTASQLRQDLSSLTGTLDRIGWKADAAVTTSGQPLQQPMARSDAESQNGHAGSLLDWDEQPSKKRNSTAELWDTALAGQDR